MTVYSHTGLHQREICGRCPARKGNFAGGSQCHVSHGGWSIVAEQILKQLPQAPADACGGGAPRPWLYGAVVSAKKQFDDS